MKTINEVSLYDLMAEEINVKMYRNEKFGFDIYLEDESGEKMAYEDGLHPYAADSFANLCQRYLTAYEKAKGLR